MNNIITKIGKRCPFINNDKKDPFMQNRAKPAKQTRKTRPLENSE